MAQKQKSRTTKSPLLQDWVFRLGSYVKFIATRVPTFFGYIISVLANVLFFVFFSAYPVSLYHWPGNPRSWNLLKLKFDIETKPIVLRFEVRKYEFIDSCLPRLFCFFQKQIPFSNFMNKNNNIYNFSDEFKLKFPELSQVELKRFWAVSSQAGAFQFRAETELTICTSIRSKF